MCTVRFIGCLHLGHRWMANHRGFTDDFYHTEAIVDGCNSVVHRKDLTYILGDVTMETDEFYPILDRLNGRKIVVLGNHDLPKHTRELLKHVETVAGMIDYKDYCLTHCPIHPSEISFYKGNIHAHIHENELQDFVALDHYGDIDGVISTVGRYYCVDAHRVKYIPKSIEDLLK